jgi:hypothetical protein
LRSNPKDARDLISLPRDSPELAAAFSRVEKSWGARGSHCSSEYSEFTDPRPLVHG